MVGMTREMCVVCAHVIAFVSESALIQLSAATDWPSYVTHMHVRCHPTTTQDKTHGLEAEVARVERAVADERAVLREINENIAVRTCLWLNRTHAF